MDARTERLGEHTAEAGPVWARSLGAVPDEPLDRLEWQNRAAKVASYRETYGYEDPADAIGPEPVNSPDARASWHAAFAALGPVDGVDLREAPDGRCSTCGPATRPRPHGRPAMWVTSCGRSVSALTAWAGMLCSLTPRRRRRGNGGRGDGRAARHACRLSAG